MTPEQPTVDALTIVICESIDEVLRTEDQTIDGLTEDEWVEIELETWREVVMSLAVGREEETRLLLASAARAAAEWHLRISKEEQCDS